MHSDGRNARSEALVTFYFPCSRAHFKAGSNQRKQLVLIIINKFEACKMTRNLLAINSFQSVLLSPATSIVVRVLTQPWCHPLAVFVDWEKWDNKTTILFKRLILTRGRKKPFHMLGEYLNPQSCVVNDTSVT